MSRAPGSFLGSLSGPVDQATYDAQAGWRWISWGPWGRAERFSKLAAYLLGTIAPAALYLDGTWSFAGDQSTTAVMQIAGWLLLVVLTPLQVLDIRDRWLMRDYLSNLISVPRTLSHPLIGLLLLHAAPVAAVQRVLFWFAGILLMALFFEGVFLRRHLGREHRHPGGIPQPVFWVFLAGYVAIYLLVFGAGCGF